MNAPYPIPAPVPPAQPTDLDKMVEAAAQEVLTHPLPTMSQFLTSGQCHDARVKAVSAILLRHLQPLAEQLAKAVQVLREAMGEAVEDETLLGMAHLIVSQRDNAYNESKVFQERLAEVQQRKIEACIAWTEANDKLTAAQEELARAKQEIEAYRQIGHDINSALNKTGSHGISEVEQIEWLGAELERLHSSAQKGAEDGKRDTDRICTLVRLYVNCPHAEITYNDDAHEGLIGWSVNVDGCEPLSLWDPTLRGLLDQLAARAKPEASP